MPDLTPLEAAETLEDIAAVSDLKAVDGTRSGLVNLTKNDASSLRVIASYLRKIVSGEYAPVVHAHWVHRRYPHPREELRCSHCSGVFGAELERYRCPLCGALMDGKDDSHV